MQNCRMNAPPDPNPLSVLIEYLGPDPDSAGEKYEALRRTLVKFFEWRGASIPDLLADRTFDRVAGKIVEGEQIQNINVYCQKVAYFIYLEWINRDPDHKHLPIEEHDQPHQTLVQPTATEYQEDEKRFECQKKCLEELPAENKELVKDYFMGVGRTRIERREEIAKNMGISRTALGNRISRLLGKLKECEQKCLKKR